MTAKGRIERAIEKAVLAKGRRVAETERDAGRAPTAFRQTTDVPPAPLPVFAQVAYDAAQCAENRVMLDESTLRATGAAAYRMLRTRVLHRTRANQWTTLGVTSPSQGDGKSVTALNLALSIAREGNNQVFLIDLDMRNPKLCRYLGAVPPADINRYLAGDARADEVLFSIGVENLTLAGTLTSTDEASELLASGRVEELFGYIHSIASRPLVLVDLPPLLSTDDGLIVASKVDACLLVIAEGKSRRDGAAKALELLAEFKLAGVILNRSRAVFKDYYGP